MMRRLLLSIGVLLSVVGNGEAQERAPNRSDVVRAVSDADPARFACAHVESRSCKSDWIKAVAAALHATDGRWGLNGKRGNPNDISMDVVTWRVGPTDRHVQAFDICGACGGGSPSVVWNDITNWGTIGQPGTAVWLQPGPVSGPTPTPTPTPTPNPTPAPTVNLTPILDVLQRIEGKVDAALARLQNPVDLSQVYAKLDALSAQVDEARKDIQGRPTSLVGCLVGRVPKAFGGTTEVRFCPEAPQ